ncbi:hypothetical protein [Zunongwangia sp. HGR-M22]|uniref:hypothetical protein n=1 Tax=Zunongwangia sp. HGR-M22 TaxID=3015168 RepID=UPI0022DE6C55|nr:hypothetical protein [Zunongwangia sp. HGR-M22]WBL25366.1 hypothetical protein PBT91_15900 [Zunongwangia sp. HGR-M22]
MPFFEKHKALLLTILIFMVLLLLLFNWHLENSSQKNQEFLVDLSAVTEALKTEKKEPEDDQKQEITSSKTQTHRAFNQNQEARSSNFNKELNAIFEKNSALQQATSKNSETATSGSYTLKNSGSREKQQSDGNNSTSKISSKSGSLKNSSISFNLKGRTAVNIPNPIYTCSLSGKIVINIKVDESGRVKSTSFNEASSSTDNKCLVENALLYASEAVFSKLSGRDDQPGTITYQFKP